MSSLPARRLMAARLALTTVVTIVYMTAPVTHPALWGVIGLVGVTATVFAIGLSGLVRHRWADRALPSLLDALIITAGLALSVWAYLTRPLTVVEGPTWQQRAISIACPLGGFIAPAGLDANGRRGDVIRADLYRKTVRVLDHLDGTLTRLTERYPLRLKG
jgi:hypothetical protein